MKHSNDNDIRTKMIGRGSHFKKNEPTEAEIQMEIDKVESERLARIERHRQPTPGSWEFTGDESEGAIVSNLVNPDGIEILTYAG